MLLWRNRKNIKIFFFFFFFADKSALSGATLSGFTCAIQKQTLSGVLYLAIPNKIDAVSKYSNKTFWQCSVVSQLQTNSEYSECHFICHFCTITYLVGRLNNSRYEGVSRKHFSYFSTNLLWVLI